MGTGAILARLRIAVGLAWRGGPWILLACAATELLAGVVPVVSAWLVKSALDRLAQPSGVGAAAAIGVAFAVTFLAGAVTAPMLRYLHAELGRRVSVQAKDRLYAAVNRFDVLTTFETPIFRDRLRMAEQASQSGPGQVVESSLGALRTATTLVGMLATVALLAPVLSLLLVASAFPALVAEIRLSRRRANLLWHISPTQRREFFFSELLTSLSAAKEIRLFGTGHLFHRRMLDELTVANAAQRRHDLRELAVQGALAILSAVLVGGALWWTMVAAASGNLSVGDVAAIVVAVGGALTSLASLVAQIAAGHHAGLLLDHFQQLVETPPDRTDPVGAKPARIPDPSPSFSGIELRDLWFRYGIDQPWVLRGVNLAIPAERAIALVGENGSGKSTLVKLLCRFYDPTRGAILWDGIDIREIPVADLRRRIGAVFQDFMSYEMTASENVALGGVDGRGELDLRAEPILAAADQAEIRTTLDRLPRGPDTMLSRTFSDYTNAEDGGVLLSGGQWQRLALARALFRGQRELLILDEPSAGLDAIAEHRIHQRLTQHRRGRTSVLVSHRLNTVRDADEIVVLSNGRIVERGTHDELVVAAGAYAELFTLQAAGYQEAPGEASAGRGTHLIAPPAVAQP